MRPNLIAGRNQIQGFGLAPATIRRKLAAISSLFEYFCNENAVESNPVACVQRPSADNNIGKTTALSDDQARMLLQAPEGGGLNAVRDRAIIATYLFHGLRRTELAGLEVRSLAERSGVLHLRVMGKGSKTRYLPAHPAALGAIVAYLELAGHGDDSKGSLFRPVRNNTTGVLDEAITGGGIYQLVMAYALKAGVHLEGLCLRVAIDRCNECT